MIGDGPLIHFDLEFLEPQMQLAQNNNSNPKEASLTSWLLGC